MIFLPRGTAVRQKVNPARINLPEAMEKLRKGLFSGFLRFDAEQGTGVILFQKGQLVSAIYISQGETERLIAYDAIARIFEVSIEGHAVLNIFKVSADLVLSLHALLHGHYLIKGKALPCLDIESLLNKIRDEGLTACLRVYAGDRVSLIFFEQGYALGFFVDNSFDLQDRADLDDSVAALPYARLDLIETQSSDRIVLADLMASADLRPIWQRTRAALMEERQRHEETALREQEECLNKRREQLVTMYKRIAENYLGKIGVTQVEKAAACLDGRIDSSEITTFYNDLSGLARLVISESKIQDMIDEMKKAMSSLSSCS
jgi:hypothetical protein